MNVAKYNETHGRGIYGSVYELHDRIVRVDPVFADMPFEKLRNTRYFADRDRIVNDGRGLEIGDLVAVHVTPTFPDDGVIRTRWHYQPEIIRDTIHFALNHPVDNPGLYGNFDERTYAILIPLDKLKGRLLNFYPVDTFVLGDLELPHGSVVMTEPSGLKDGIVHPFIRGLIERDPEKYIGEVVGKIGNADVVLTDYSKSGQKVNGFRRAVYQQIIDMGYIPMIGGMWNWEGDSWWNEWESLPKREGLEVGTHEGHWTKDTESLSMRLYSYMHPRGEIDYEKRAENIEWVKNSIGKAPKQVPERHIVALRKMVEEAERVCLAQSTT